MRHDYCADALREMSDATVETVDPYDPVEEYMTPLEYLGACRLVVADLNSYNAGFEGQDDPSAFALQFRAHEGDFNFEPSKDDRPYWDIERVCKQFGLKCDRSRVLAGDALHLLRFPAKVLAADGAGPSWCQGCCGFAKIGRTESYRLYVPDYLVAFEVEDGIAAADDQFHQEGYDIGREDGYERGQHDARLEMQDIPCSHRADGVTIARCPSCSDELAALQDDRALRIEQAYNLGWEGGLNVTAGAALNEYGRHVVIENIIASNLPT
jgi:hypothetical protein